MISVLCGGVGAARLLRALTPTTSSNDIRAIVNVGDDLTLHGLSICPDIDSILYTLSGRNNEELGWGLRGESWRVMQRLEELGGATWFRLGDLDLATHLYRTQRLSEGATKTQVTRELAQRLGVDVTLLPVSDDPVATTFDTEVGSLSFQEYFVAHRHSVRVHGIEFRGAERAVLSPDARDALLNASRIIIAPSNPLISIGPLLAIDAVREILADRRRDVVAVSPIIAGAALKGPADRLLRELGYESSCVGVAQYYRGLIDTLIIDHADADRADEVAATGCRVRVAATVMAADTPATELLEAVLG